MTEPEIGDGAFYHDTKGTVIIDLPIRIEKKHSVRFDTTDAESPVTTIYISRAYVAENHGLPWGVRVTIEPIPEN